MAGGCPAASSFSCLAKKRNQKKATPTSPKPRSSSASGGRQRTRPALLNLILFFVGGTQTPLPLIHPTHSNFGGSVRGMKVKISLTPCSRANRINGFAREWDYCVLAQVHESPLHHWLGFDLPPSQSRRKMSLPGGSAAKVFEPRSPSKYQQKRGEFFAARPAGSFSGVSGMSGVAFSLVTFFWRSKRK